VCFYDLFNADERSAPFVEDGDFFSELEGGGDWDYDTTSGLAGEQNLTLSEVVDLSESPSVTASSDFTTPFEDVTDGLEGFDAAADAGLEGIGELSEAAVAAGALGVLSQAGRSARQLVEGADDDYTEDLRTIFQQTGGDPSSAGQSLVAQESSRNLTTAAA